MASSRTVPSWLLSLDIEASRFEDETERGGWSHPKRQRKLADQYEEEGDSLWDDILGEDDDDYEDDDKHEDDDELDDNVPKDDDEFYDLGYGFW